MENVWPFEKLTPVRVMVAAPSNVIQPLSVSMYFLKSLSLEPRPSPFSAGGFAASLAMSGSFGVFEAADPPAPGRFPIFIALLSLKLGGFLAPVPGTAGADLWNPGGSGRDIPPGSFKFDATPPARPPPGAPGMFMFMLRFLLMLGGGPAARAPMFMRCSWRARARCMMSDGRLFALGVGRLAVVSRPATLEVGLIELTCAGSDTVLREGTRRCVSLGEEKPGSESAPELVGSRGVLPSDDSSTEPGEVAPPRGSSSAGVTGSESSA